MSSTRSRIGRQAFLVMALAMLVLSSLPVSPAGAQPINDEKTVDAKVKDFKHSCETMGGTAKSRPSAMDVDKTISNCSGGELDGWYCVFTPTTRDCDTARDEADDPNVNPGQSDATDLTPTDTPDSNPLVDQPAGEQGQQVTGNPSSDDRPSDNQQQKGKKKDKKRGKHGKGRR
jgi:hypothetical protein